MALSPQVRALNKLCPCVLLRLVQLQGKMDRAKIDTTVIETIRATDRQRYYLKIGVSTTLNSLHLPQPPNKLSLAVDIAPTQYLKMKHWNPAGVWWATMGESGKLVGLEWGGDWRTFVDKSHFQLKKCLCPKE